MIKQIEKFLLTVLLVFLSTGLLLAQNKTVTGRVVGVDGKPAVGSSVTVVGTSNKTTTDENGAFSIAVPEGRYQVEVAPAPDNPLGKEIFIIAPNDKNVVGTLFLGRKDPVIGLSEFSGRSKYIAATDAQFPDQSIGNNQSRTQQPIVSPEQVLEELNNNNNNNNNQGSDAPPLEDGVEGLDEVVLIGYGTVKKSDATGSVVAIEEKDFNQGINVSPETLLQGKLSGIQVTSSSGEPGAGMNVRIRGASSVRANNNPLIVVDGFPISGGDVSDGTQSPSDGSGVGSSSARNPFNFINPADIARIDVLKDASATAIYGSRGANGVILITTKKGSYKKPTKVTLTTEFSLSTVSKKLDLLNKDQYLDAAFAAVRGRTPTTTRSKFDSANDFGGNTDWQDQIFRTAFTQNYTVGLEGGTKASSYRFSAGYLNQQGVVRKMNLEKFTAQFNFAQRFLDNKLEVGGFVNYSLLNDVYASNSNNAGFEGNVIGAALQANPTRQVWELNRSRFALGNSPSLGGRFFQQGNVFRNPVAMLNYMDETSRTTRLLGNLYLSAKILPWLTYKASVGIDYSSSTRKGSYDYYLDFNDIGRVYNNLAAKAALDDANVTTKGGFGYITTRILESHLMEHTLNATTKFGNLDVGALVGYSYQNFANDFYTTSGRNFVSNQIPFYNQLDGADNSTSLTAISSEAKIDELQSFFGRVNLGYKSKYLLTLTVRADGSSKFGPNNKYGVFPSAAFAWRISEESFVPAIFNDLKLRVGYGVIGNQEFPGRISRGVFTIDQNGNRTYTNTPNPNIKWESTAGFNAGLDFAILNNRIYGTVEYFTKSTTDLLFLNTTPAPSPTTNVWENLPATVTNSGVEFNVSAVVIDKAIRWTVGLNATFIENKLTDYNSFKNTGEINGQGLSGAFAQRLQSGQPLNAFYMFEFTGDFDTDGNPLFFNDEGQKVVSADADKRFVGSPNPDLLYGLSNTFQYKNWDLTFLLSGVAGNKVYNNTANALFYPAALATGKNITVAASNSRQSPNAAAVVSTQYLEDGSFLRLTNAVLGYNFPIKSNKYVKGIRAYLSVQNLFVLTSYTGYDPEVNTPKPLDEIPSFAIDYYSTPKSRTFTLGLNFIF